MCSSSDCAECVPALCTHRPSHLPIGRSGKMFGVVSFALSGVFDVTKLIKPYRLEEGEVVTRFP
jgi:hypothetical protein